MFKYATLFYQAEERKIEDIRTQATADAKNLYDYSVEQRKMQEERDKKRRLRDCLYFTIGLALLIFCILYHRWYVKKKAQEEELNKLTIEMQKIQLENQEKEHAIQQQIMHLHEEEKKNKYAQERIEVLHQHVQNIEKEKEKCLSNIAALEEEIKRQDTALTKAQSSAHEAAQRESHLKRLYDDEKARGDRLDASEREAQEQIKQLKQEAIERNARIERMDELTRNYRNEEISSSKIVKRFVDCIKENTVSCITNDDWGKLRATVETRYPEFYQTMHKRHHLQQDEYRACLLTIAGRFRPTDIETVLGWTYNTASKKRLQLLKKIFGIKGSAADFDRMVRESVKPKEMPSIQQA